MNTIFRNFLSVLRRFKMATVLNVLGLSVAFAAFMVIMMQLDYDWNFARMHKDAGRIYRLELVTDKGGQAVLSRPMVETFVKSSPHILAGTICSFWGKHVVTVGTGNDRNSFEEEMIITRPELTEVFDFDLLYGSDRAMETPERVLILQTSARPSRLYVSRASIHRRYWEEMNGPFAFRWLLKPFALALCPS